MIELKMKCDCCGKEFYSKYWEGGYIDHCENFSDKFDWFVKHRNEEDIAEYIICDGNNYRRVFDIQERLNCFSIYCKNKEYTELFNKIEIIVKESLNHLNELDKIREKIDIMTENLSIIDKEYIGL